MVWQQWVLLVWYVTRIPSVVYKEIIRVRKTPVEKRDRSIVIGICVSLAIVAGLIALVVTI